MHAQKDGCMNSDWLMTIIIIITNDIYMVQFQKNAANEPSQPLQAVSSFCHE